MKKKRIIESLLIPIMELSGIVALFFWAYYLRQITDGIPFIQLRVPYLSTEQFLPFIISGTFFWFIVFASGGLYSYSAGRPFFEEIRQVIWRSSIWFLLYIGFVYLSLWFLFEREIPRLIILYVWIFSALYSIILRKCIYTLMGILYTYGYMERDTILILDSAHIYDIPESIYLRYISLSWKEKDTIYTLIRHRQIDTLLMIDHEKEEGYMSEIVKLCNIYGVHFAYPRILSYVQGISQHDTFIGGIPVIESSAVAISIWERMIKRICDILLSSLWLILLAPIFILIGILIAIEDPSGPIIYKNRRIGLSGKEFSLYKFRYMYWKYCIKDGYREADDSALIYEEHLKQKQDMRKWPLYKIADDPRKTRVGSIIERLSLDELPQLLNVLLGNMSLVWPRPHQPREVDLYEEHHYQVLTVKPGITGMAQVYGREKNSFDEEVGYDTYYIEHYSLILDGMILMKTIGVVFLRIFR